MDLETLIQIDIDHIRKDNATKNLLLLPVLFGGYNTVAGVYGHEQRHVRSLHLGADELQEILTVKEGVSCSSHMVCQFLARMLESDGKKWWKDYDNRESRHLNTASPWAYREYPPIGNMPPGT